MKSRQRADFFLTPPIKSRHARRNTENELVDLLKSNTKSSRNGGFESDLLSRLKLVSDAKKAKMPIPSQTEMTEIHYKKLM